MKKRLNDNENFVLDTSAVLSGKPIPCSWQLLVPQAVKDELQHSGRDKRALEFLIAAGAKLCTPSKSAVKKILEFAAQTGDDAKLSRTDIEVLALAQEFDAVILTDDYSIQNVAAVLGLRYMAVAQTGIRKKIFWRYCCRSCGRNLTKIMKTCPVCGGKIKRILV